MLKPSRLRNALLLSAFALSVSGCSALEAIGGRITLSVGEAADVPRAAWTGREPDTVAVTAQLPVTCVQFFNAARDPSSGVVGTIDAATLGLICKQDFDRLNENGDLVLVALKEENSG